MKTGLKVAGLVVLVAAVFGVGLFLGTNTAQAQVTTGLFDQAGQGGPGGPVGNGVGCGWMADYRDQMHAAVASALGISVDELDKAIQAGKTPWQIAQEKGISAEDFQKAMLKIRTDIINQAVKDGKLTQAQADQILANMQQHPGFGFGPGRGPHMGPRPQGGPYGGPNFNGNPG